MDEARYYIDTPALPGTYEVEDATPVELTEGQASMLNGGDSLLVYTTRGWPLILVPRPIRLQERI